jgi:hypothetical protein
MTKSRFLPSFHLSFQLSVWCEKCVAARHLSVIRKQLLISNDRNRVRWVVLGLSEDGACTDLFENFSVNSSKGDLSNATAFNPPLFLLVNTLKEGVNRRQIRLIESNAKCRHLKKFICKGTLRQVFICQRPPPLLVFFWGWSRNVVGSESGQIHSETPAEFGLSKWGTRGKSISFYHRLMIFHLWLVMEWCTITTCTKISHWHHNANLE